MRSTTCCADRKPKERKFGSNNRIEKMKKKSYDLFLSKVGEKSFDFFCPFSSNYL